MSAARGPHDHGFDLPVVLGPALLQTLLVVGGLVAVSAVGLRPFVEPDAVTEKAATLGAAGAGVALLLRAGPMQGMPTGVLAAAAVAGLAVPFVAVRGGRPRLRGAASAVAPAVVLVAVGAATATSTVVGALFAAVVALAWSVLLRTVENPVPAALAALGAVLGVPLLLAGAVVG